MAQWGLGGQSVELEQGGLGWGPPAVTPSHPLPPSMGSGHQEGLWLLKSGQVLSASAVAMDREGLGFSGTHVAA